MRLLNMNELQHVRRTMLAGLSCIGKGTFASVYAENETSPEVTKVTIDSLAYQFLACQSFSLAREHAESFFPRLIEDHGDIGESRGSTAYIVKLERLQPVSTTAHRRLIREWIAEYDAFEADWEFPRNARGSDRYREMSARFCEVMSVKAGPFQEAFGALVQFFSNYGGSLDLRYCNFMERPSTGELIFNDVVCDFDLLNPKMH